MNDFVIQAENLCLQYQRKMALDSLTLSVARGGTHAIVGANGAGKSSLFRVLLGFETPDSGHARILGVTGPRLPERHAWLRGEQERCWVRRHGLLVCDAGEQPVEVGSTSER